jgi:hypothetical protein
LRQKDRLVGYLSQRPRPVPLTQARPWHRNDNAHVELRNRTRVREHFGYERYDNPEVTARIHALCAGAPGQWIHHCLPTLKLEPKQRRGRRLVRQYGPAQTPSARVLAAAEVSAEAKARLQALQPRLNPFQLARDIERQKKAIEARHRLPA